MANSNGFNNNFNNGPPPHHGVPNSPYAPGRGHHVMNSPGGGYPPNGQFGGGYQPQFNGGYGLNGAAGYDPFNGAPAYGQLPPGGPPNGPNGLQVFDRQQQAAAPLVANSNRDLIKNFAKAEKILGLIDDKKTREMYRRMCVSACQTGDKEAATIIINELEDVYGALLEAVEKQRSSLTGQFHRETTSLRDRKQELQRELSSLDIALEDKSSEHKRQMAFCTGAVEELSGAKQVLDGFSNMLFTNPRLEGEKLIRSRVEAMVLSLVSKETGLQHVAPQSIKSMFAPFGTIEDAEELTLILQSLDTHGILGNIYVSTRIDELETLGVLSNNNVRHGLPFAARPLQCKQWWFSIVSETTMDLAQYEGKVYKPERKVDGSFLFPRSEVQEGQPEAPSDTTNTRKRDSDHDDRKPKRQRVKMPNVGQENQGGSFAPGCRTNHHQ